VGSNWGDICEATARPGSSHVPVTAPGPGPGHVSRLTWVKLQGGQASWKLAPGSSAGEVKAWALPAIQCDKILPGWCVVDASHIGSARKMLAANTTVVTITLHGFFLSVLISHLHAFSSIPFLFSTQVKTSAKGQAWDHTCNPTTPRSGGSRFKASPGKRLVGPSFSTSKLVLVGCTYHPSYRGSTNRITVQDGPGIKQDLIPKSN
jgi:hypothetical protein